MKNTTVTKKALSTVITNLIILVVAVLLAGVVTYYATNVVMTRTTQEEVRIRKPHVWVQEGDNAYAALMIQNIGGRDVLIDKVTIRGVEAPWGGKSEVIATGNGVLLIFGPLSLSNTPIEPGSIKITATVSLPIDPTTITITDTDNFDGTGTLAGGVSASGTINYATGEWTLLFVVAEDGPPNDGTPITASYAVEGAVAVNFYLVQSGDDVSGDFELKELAGVVYAQIGSVPAAQGDWKSPISDMPLKSSGTMMFFITNPTNIALNDVGTTISMTVFTSNAQWIVETVVQAAEIEDLG